MKNNLKFLFVIPYYIPAYSYGGPVKVVKDLAEHMVKLGHDVTILTTDAFDNKNRVVLLNESINGVKVIRFRNLSNYFAKNFNLYLPFKMKKWIRNNISDFDIVHCHDYFTILNVWISKYAKKYKIPYIIQPHGCLDHVSLKSKMYYVKKMFLYFFSRIVLYASHIIALTNYEEKFLNSLFKGIDLKINVIPNGIDLDESNKIKKIDLYTKYNIDKSHKIITFLGRIQYIKGLDISIRALAKIKDKVDFTFLIIGPDEGERSNLDILIKECDLEKQVVFAGMLEGNNKLSILKSSALFISNSRSEGFGLTIIEACSVGVPVIISKNCPLNKVEELNAGRIIPNDPDIFANHILEVLTDDNLLNEYSINAYKVAGYYSLENNIQKFEKLYKEISN